MAFRKRAIPEVRISDSYQYQFEKTLREVAMTLQDERASMQGLESLPATATLADVIAKVNQIVEKLNG